MRVTVLGSGGFDNEGLPFNAFLVDGHVLVDCPPDILVSLGREGVAASALDTVYVSHTHGDHVFGLPFLLFAFWKRNLKAPRLIGPSDLKAATLAVASLAISPSHPYVAWMDREVEFLVAGLGPLPAVAGCAPEFYRTWHEKETWGLGLRRGGTLLFQYLPDTYWHEGLLGYIGLGADLLLCDVNGSGGVKSVHMGREDLEAALAALAARGSGGRPPRLTLGTHLSGPLPDLPGGVATVRPGQVLDLGAGERESLLGEIAAYAAAHPEEADLSGRMAAFIRERPGAFLRSCLEGHVTGSAFVVDPRRAKVLLVHHRKLDRWLQPGGHCEAGETAFEAALRECQEETGLEPRPLLGGRIFDLDIHEIPGRGEVPAHFHYDVRYLVEADQGEEAASEESLGIGWFDPAEVLRQGAEPSLRRPLARLIGSIREGA